MVALHRDPSSQLPISAFVAFRIVAVVAVIPLDLVGDREPTATWVTVASWSIIVCSLAALAVMTVRGTVRPAHLLASDIVIALAFSWLGGPLTLAGMLLAVVSAALWAFLHPTFSGVIPLMLSIMNVGFLTTNGRLDPVPADWVVGTTLGLALLYVLGLKSLYLMMTRCARDGARRADLLAGVFAANPDPMIVLAVPTEPGGQIAIVEINPAMNRFHPGLSERSPGELVVERPGGWAKRWLNAARKVAATQEPVRYADVINDGNGDSAMEVIDVLFFPVGVIPEHNLVAIVITDATQRKHATDQLAHAAAHDPLTGLPNRSRLLQILDEMARPEDRSPAEVALFLVDIERFAVVNSTLGYGTGDRVLAALGSRLTDLLRPGSEAFRLDGDTFAVTAAVRGERDAVAFGSQLAAELRKPMRIDDTPLAVGVAIGIAIGPEDGVDPEHLLRRADIATRSASGRRDPVVRFTDELDQINPTPLILAAELPDAIQRGELEVSYQPQLDLGTLTICGVEALVRWNHPTRGRLKPDQFVGLATLGGYLHELTVGVLSDALSDLRSWHEQGYPIDVSVNIGAMSLRDPGFAKTLGRLLRAAGVDGTHLRLELTEADLVVDAEAARETVEAIARHGVHVAVDDFGTGYSSLAHLSDLHVAEIKIDRRFVLGMESHIDDTVIIRSIVDLGHKLGAFVTAEGVEDQATLDELRTLGCDRAQGYFIGRPSDAAEIVPLIRRNHLVQLATEPSAPTGVEQQSPR